MNKLKNNKGFTLVELLVAIAILGIVIAPLANSFIMSAKMNTMAKLDAEAMTIAQGYMENVKALKEFPTTGVNGNDITRALAFTHPGYTATVQLVPNTLYVNQQDETTAGGGTGGTGGGTTTGVPKGLVRIQFTDNNLNSGYTSTSVTDKQFVLYCNGTSKSTDIVFNKDGNNQLQVAEYTPIPFNCDTDEIVVYVDAGNNVLTEDYTINLYNKSNDATKSIDVLVISPQDFDKNCKVDIKLGKATVNRNITGISVRKVSENILYHVVIKVKYIYDGQDKYVEVFGEKVF